MKHLLLITLLALGCGIEPIAPIGCTGGGQCICDSSGHCHWVFTDCD